MYKESKKVQKIQLRGAPRVLVDALLAVNQELLRNLRTLKMNA